MSGYMWEADKQPNLCEAASTFTFSSINLLIAIPMFLIDLVVNAAISVVSLVWLIIGPVLEYATLGLVMLAEALGIEEYPSNLSLVMYTLGALLVAGAYKDNKVLSHGSVEALMSRYLNLACSVLGLMSVLALPEYDETAAFPRLIFVSLMCSTAALSIKAMFREYHAYLAQELTSIHKFATGFISVLENEAVVFLLIAAFGYPTFTSSDEVTNYYCVVPLMAFVMILTRLQRAEVPAVSNGSAVAVKEKAEAEVVEPVAVVEEKQEPEAKPEEAVDNTTEAAAEENKGEEAAKADAEGTVDTADGAVAEESAAVEAKEAAPAAVSKPCQYVTGLKNLCSTLKTKVCSVCSPVLATASCPFAYLAGLPWNLITFFLVTNVAKILEGVAWFHLTQNHLAVCLPILSCLVPPVVARYGGNLKSMCSYTAALVDWLPEAGRTVVFYLMITNTVEI